MKQGLLTALIVVPVVVGITQLDTTYAVSLFGFLLCLFLALAALQLSRWLKIRSIESSTQEQKHKVLHRLVVLLIAALGVVGALIGYLFAQHFETIFENPGPTLVFFIISIGTLLVLAAILSNRLSRKLEKKS